MHDLIYGIIGPTASGKTQLGNKLVRSGKFVIINADSQQIYSYLPHLSCVPKDLNQHFLYGIIDKPFNKFNVALWAELVHKEVEQAQQVDKIPVILGGTGMYFHVLQKGIASLIEPEKHIIEFVKNLSFEQLLKCVSPQEAEKFKDRMRLEKAAAIFLQTNEYMQDQQLKTENKFKMDNLKIYALLPKRPIIWQNIENRLNLELSAMVDDVYAFNDIYNKCDISMIGYKEITSYLEMNKHELKNQALLNSLKQEIFYKTRQYAKRQETYIRNCLSIEEYFSCSQQLCQLFEKIN
jgi:tRNA dimethylallyltransferase